MPRRPSPTHHRAGVIRGSIITLVAGSVLGLVLCLPIDRASLVSGMVVSVAASTAPAWLNRDGRNDVQKRAPGRRAR